MKRIENKEYIIYALLKCFLYSLYIDVLFSVYIEDLLNEFLLPTVIFALVIGASCAFFIFSSNPKLWRFYWKSHLLFGVGVLLRHFVIKVPLLPQREISYADGFVFPVVLVIFLAFIELFEVAILLLAKLNEKPGDGKKTGAGSLSK